MLTGVIKRLLKNLGCGFIKGSYGHEVFSHYSQLYGAVFDRLNEGQSVGFYSQDRTLPKCPSCGHTEVLHEFAENGRHGIRT